MMCLVQQLSEEQPPPPPPPPFTESMDTSRQAQKSPFLGMKYRVEFGIGLPTPSPGLATSPSLRFLLHNTYNIFFWMLLLVWLLFLALGGGGGNDAASFPQGGESLKVSGLFTGCFPFFLSFGGKAKCGKFKCFFSF